MTFKYYTLKDFFLIVELIDLHGQWQKMVFDDAWMIKIRKHDDFCKTFSSISSMTVDLF